MIKLTLATPAYRRLVDVEHVAQGIALRMACAADGRFEFHGFNYTDSYSLDWARNRLLHGAMILGTDWLLTVDADTYHRDGEATLRMIADGDRLGAAVIAAPVRIRGKTVLYNARQRRADGYYAISIDAMRDRVMEVDAIGTAFMAISCRWMRSHWPNHPWFVTRHLPGPEPRLLSEDLAFCEGVKDRGGRVFVDARFMPTHVGVENNEQPGVAVEGPVTARG